MLDAQTIRPANSAKNLSGAKHRELSEILRGRIESGRYRPGERIPTEHELGRTFEVSRNTVRQAIATLEEAGYLLRRRGAGTFVGEIGSAGRPIPPLREMGFLLVDLALGRDRWAIQTTRTAHQWLAQRNVHLSISHWMSDDLLKGRRPGLLRPEECQAVLLDGWVQNLHCALLEEMAIPYLVIGNRPLEARHPRARHAFGRIIDRAVRHLHELRPNQPVALMVEPFRLHMTHEMFQAYAQAAQAMPQGHPILQTTEDAAADAALGKLLDAQPGPLSLITTDTVWARASVEYRRRGLSAGEYPVVVMGDPRILRPAERADCHVIPISGDHLIGEALPRFVGAYNEGKADQLRIDVDVEQIQPPTGHP